MNKIYRIWFVAGMLLVVVLAGSLYAAHSKASVPQGITITIYDTGMALVRELRRVALAAGETSVRIERLPSHLDPSTVSFVPSAGGGDLTLTEQQFAHDLADVTTLFQRYLGKKITVHNGDGAQEGVLAGVPSLTEEQTASRPLVLRTDEDSAMVYLKPDSFDAVTFPDVGEAGFLEPTLLWRVRATSEGVQNIRLHYATDQISWKIFYELVLAVGGKEGSFSGRVGLTNRSGVDYGKARIRLVATERGVEHAARWKETDVTTFSKSSQVVLRYLYGKQHLTFEDWLLSQAPLNTYEMPGTLDLPSGSEKIVSLYTADRLPISRFYVYDGVKFDRFQRNRRNDWNYGTESHNTVEIHLEFENSKSNGLGVDLPPGRFRLYQQRASGMVDLLGEDSLAPTPEGEAGHIRVGRARGLRGERERTGYSEVVPLHEYEETFEIRLQNDSDEEAEIRVVEHLYRWRDFEIVRADTEYIKTGPQTIEFHPRLKPAGRRAIHYTVRYTW